ncbi:hypothetical protein ACRAWG_27380 [Methylobacterium sp. P31]
MDDPRMAAQHGRCGDGALAGRPALGPGRRRLAVSVALNLESFDFGAGFGAELAPGGPQPDVLDHHRAGDRRAGASA